MAEAYQRGANSGNEPNQVAQVPSKAAEGGISQKAAERPDIAGDIGASDAHQTAPELQTTHSTSNTADASQATETHTTGTPQSSSATHETAHGTQNTPDTVNQQQQQHPAQGDTAVSQHAVDDNAEGGEPAKNPEGEVYPEQKHAGKVGYGPNYVEAQGQKVTLGERVQGFKEEVKGKVTKNHDLEQQGKDKRTGEAARKKAEELNNPHPLGENTEGDAKGDDDQKHTEPQTAPEQQPPQADAATAKDRSVAEDQTAHHNMGDEKAGNNETVANANPATVQGEPSRKAGVNAHEEQYAETGSKPTSIHGLQTSQPQASTHIGPSEVYAEHNA